MHVLPDVVLGSRLYRGRAQQQRQQESPDKPVIHASRRRLKPPRADRRDDERRGHGEYLRSGAIVPIGEALATERNRIKARRVERDHRETSRCAELEIRPDECRPVQFRQGNPAKRRERNIVEGRTVVINSDREILGRNDVFMPVETASRQLEGDAHERGVGAKKIDGEQTK